MATPTPFDDLGSGAGATPAQTPTPFDHLGQGDETQPDTLQRLTAPYNPEAAKHGAVVRTLDAAGGAVLGTPGAIYHAFADPATEEETKQAGGPQEVTGMKRVGLGVQRLTGLGAAAQAFQDYKDGKVSL